jgi:two-component system sensor histidine kinase QseC
MKKYSLKRALLVTVGSSLLVALSISALWIFYETNHEIEELFDAELAQHGRIVDAIFSWHVTEHGTPPTENGGTVVEVDYDAPEVVHSSIGTIFVGHHYEKKIAFRVTDLKGQTLYYSHNFPDHIDPIMTPGFHAMELDDALWHLFSIKSRLGPIRVEVMQEQSIRRELSTDVSLGTLLPLQIILPVILFILLLLVQIYFKPLTVLAQQLRDRPADSFKRVGHEKTPTEVMELVDTINTALERMEQSFEREKRFTADAAHELRNALAALKAGSQSLDYSEASADRIRASSDRMAHLIEQLLLLNKIGADFAPSMTQVSLAPLLRSKIAELYEQMEQRGLQVNLEAQDTVVVNGNETLLDVLITNLLTNAIKYAESGSEIQLHLDADSLQMRNTLKAGHEIDVDRLTDRFYRGKDSGAAGAGLGLGIVQLIVERHHFRLEFLSADNTFAARLFFFGAEE